MTATIVFDLDGTLVDTAPDLMAALAVALRAEGVEPPSPRLTRPMIGAGARAMIIHGLATAGRSLPDARVDELLAVFLAYYKDHIADLSRPFEGVAEALDALEAGGMRLAVCTNKNEAFARQLLETLGLLHRFSAVTGGDTFARRKPDPSHLTGTIAAAGGVVERAVMVGDSETDFHAGRNAGVPVVLVDFGYTLIPIADLGADVVISHFRDLGHGVEKLLALPSTQSGTQRAVSG